MTFRSIVQRARRSVDDRRRRRDLYGIPDPIAASRLGLIADRRRWGPLGRCIWESRRIQGWVRGDEAVALATAAARLGGAPVIVEIGSFVGCSTVLLAGACRLRGAGRVHAIDPFAPLGDAFSVPIYESIAGALGMSLRERFERNLRRAGLLDWVTIHQTTATAAASHWSGPIDMLYLDGDQSPAGARDAYRSWAPFLRSGGVIAINNSADAAHPPGHDGSLLVVKEFVHEPDYEEVRVVEAITFARRTPRTPCAAVIDPRATVG